MRIVIDLQAAQAENRSRGIGRYSLSLALAMARNRGQHEVFIALNGLFPESIELIRAAFEGLLPQENIRVWSSVAPVAKSDVNNDWRRQSAELLREAFLTSLGADVVHVTSLFEGLGDDAVTSIGLLSHSLPTAVTLYDLIPFIHRKHYLENPAVEAWYLEKIEYLRRADIWLAISESSRSEGVSCLGLPDGRSFNISSDADSQFQSLSISAEREQIFRQKYSLNRPFVMYTGGIDHRKNIEGLIRAYAKLPLELRQTHQLAIVCSVNSASKSILELLATQHGLNTDEVILTGFVPDDDLVLFYNLCELFVFPSWHEGFGLPALEAMRCDAPVIGANTSSLPEVIGWEEALFDPYSDESIAATIKRALTDSNYRQALVSHGKVQAQKFSWDDSARRAIAAMEQLHADRKLIAVDPFLVRRPRLAYVSPLPPERSGIADYSAELLPELARLYDIDVIVVKDTISDPWIKKNCNVRSVKWYIGNSHVYDRVLYHFGNSAFHQHMFALLKAIPGVVVLHDFFLSGIIAHMDVHGYLPGYWAQQLYSSHGYAALRDRFQAKDVRDVIWNYPCSLSVVQDSLGTIVHSPSSICLAKKWYGGETDSWAVIPLLRDPKITLDKVQARRALGFSIDDFVVCTFGILGPHKLNHRLLNAWLGSSLAQNNSCHLIFVGQNDSEEYGQELLRKISNIRLVKNIQITGWVDTEVFRQYIAAADIGVQLRTLSRGETSAAVLDCMNYGLATIVNSNGSMSDLPDDAVWKLPDEFSDKQLIEALETLWKDSTRRCQLGEMARSVILREHNPRVCAEQYAEAIERFYRIADAGLPALPNAIAKIHGLPSDAELMHMAVTMAMNFPPPIRCRQLLVDISELVQRDVKTGIQRVVRSILLEWLNNPPADYRVEPVYATVDKGYRYARRFTSHLLGCPEGVLGDDPVDLRTGDVFLVLDLAPHVAVAQQAFYQTLRQHGVRVHFVVYDLLCVLMPQYFVSGAADVFTGWLQLVTESDGAICISKAVADELAHWINENRLPHLRTFKTDWFHLGADLVSSIPSTDIPIAAKTTLMQIQSHKSFLMVGTIEPRKGHAQTLAAFELLWQTNADISLVIVGKEGWMVDEIVKKLRNHSELNKRLFWLEGISDEYLEKVYAASTCLIAASEGEGFGLPIIEAAQHKIPIIARDIPVFREVAGQYAYYFEGNEPQGLANAVNNWLKLYRNLQHQKSNEMPWLTWKQSAMHLLEKINISPLE